ncbi:MAG: serine hydrolase domain-containing protein [Bacteroidota bacterium]
MTRFFLITLLLLPMLAPAQPLKTKLDSIVNSKIAVDDPALFVGIVKDGAIIYKNIRGLANLQHQVPADENTRSNIASTAKQFTALMVLELALQGKLSLEDDIRKFIPDLYPKVKEEIKLRHLLNHTSGVRDYCDLMGIQGNAWWRRIGLDNEDVIDLLRQQEDLAFAPGSDYEYSNSGYNLLAEVIEIVAEEDFHRYSDRFFQNLGMTQTSFLESYMYVIPNQAQPYSDWGDGVWQQYPTMTSTYGEGFLYTTLDDQLRYEQLIQSAAKDGNELLLASQQPIPNSERETYGFGVELNDRFNYKSVYHAGGTGSYGSEVVRYPEEQLSIFVMTSNSRVWSGGLADEIAREFLPEKAVEVAYAAELKSVPEEPLAQDFKGQYYSASNELVRIEEKDGNLVWLRGNRNPITLVKEAENLYHTSYDDQLKIGFFEEELVLFYPSGKAFTYTEIDATPPTLADYEGLVGDYYSRELDVHFTLSLEEGNLMFVFDHWKKPKPVEAFNRNDLMARSNKLRVERDQFDRVVAISLSWARALNNSFAKQSNLQFQPKIATEGGSISVTTIGSVDGSASDILLTKNYENGNEIWSQQFGGSSYDKASSIIATEDGYLIVGSTSSYGEGNYDMFVIKTDKKGKKRWQNTFGRTMNEYGYTAEVTESGYLIKGTIQHCKDGDVFDCTTNVWMVYIDEDGNELSSQVLEEILK